MYDFLFSRMTFISMYNVYLVFDIESLTLQFNTKDVAYK